MLSSNRLAGGGPTTNTASTTNTTSGKKRLLNDVTQSSSSSKKTSSKGAKKLSAGAPSLGVVAATKKSKKMDDDDDYTADEEEEEVYAKAVVMKNQIEDSGKTHQSPPSNVKNNRAEQKITTPVDQRYESGRLIYFKRYEDEMLSKAYVSVEKNNTVQTPTGANRYLTSNKFWLNVVDTYHTLQKQLPKNMRVPRSINALKLRWQRVLGTELRFFNRLYTEIKRGDKDEKMSDAMIVEIAKHRYLRERNCKKFTWEECIKILWKLPRLNPNGRNANTNDDADDDANGGDGDANAKQNVDKVVGKQKSSRNIVHKKTTNETSVDINVDPHPKGIDKNDAITVDENEKNNDGKNGSSLQKSTTNPFAGIVKDTNTYKMTGVKLAEGLQGVETLHREIHHMNDNGDENDNEDDDDADDESSDTFSNTSSSIAISTDNHSPQMVKLFAEGSMKLLQLFEQKLQQDEEKLRREYKMQKRESWIKQAQLWLAMDENEKASRILRKIEQDELLEEQERKDKMRYQGDQS